MVRRGTTALLQAPANPDRAVGVWASLKLAVGHGGALWRDGGAVGVGGRAVKLVAHAVRSVFLGSAVRAVAPWVCFGCVVRWRGVSGGGRWKRLELLEGGA